MTMKAISTRQPHAGLIVVDAKVENRRSSIAYRGEIAIHASKVPDQAELERVLGLGMSGPFTVFGAVLAVADLVDCHTADQYRPCCPPYGRRLWGRAAAQHLVFANVRPLPEPVECTGQLWLGWPVPEEVEKKIRAQLSPNPEEDS